MPFWRKEVKRPPARRINRQSRPPARLERINRESRTQYKVRLPFTVPAMSIPLQVLRQLVDDQIGTPGEADVVLTIERRYNEHFDVKSLVTGLQVVSPNDNIKTAWHAPKAN